MTIFLDLDGTVIDSFDRHYLLLKEILRENNMSNDFDVDEYVKLKKDGYNNCKYLVDKLLINFDIAKDIQNEWIKKIEDIVWLKYDKLYDDSLEFLNSIKENKIIFLTARSNSKNVISELKWLKIYDFADEIFIVNTKEAAKNKADLIKDYINNHEDEKIIVIGDTEVDYEAAAINNLRYFILNRGFRSKYFLLEKNINSYEDFTIIRKYF